MSASSQIYINSKAHSRGDVLISMFNAAILKGIDKLMWEDKDEIKGHKSLGGGTYDTDFTQGNTQISGSIVMRHYLIESLKAQSPTGRLQDLPPTTIVVSIIGRDLKKSVYELRTVKFDGDGREFQAGSTDALAYESGLYIGQVVRVQ